MPIDVRIKGRAIIVADRDQQIMDIAAGVQAVGGGASAQGRGDNGEGEKGFKAHPQGVAREWGDFQSERSPRKRARAFRPAPLFSDLASLLVELALDLFDGEALDRVA
ncbi:MAG: hypothetical protein ACOVOE_10470, partial [Caulobacter sp.]